MREAEGELGRRGTVGCGTPGAISPASGLLKNSNSTWLNGQPLDRDLAALLERPVAIANDADCLALSEATDGAAAGAASVFAVILGTGVGGGLAIHGRVLAGPNAIAGEWGHNPLPWPELARAARRALLLRPAGLHRDLAVGSRARARLPRGHRHRARVARDRRRGRRRATRLPKRRCSATRTGSRAASLP